MPKVYAATNPYGISRGSSALDVTAPDAPNTQTYHGFSIQIGGKTIGRITEWTPVQLDREINHIFELNADTWGQPVDIIPGRATNFDLAFARAEVWGQDAEVAFGLADDVFSLLIDQRAPFQIREVYKYGSTIVRQVNYRGCWFKEKNVTQFTGEGDGIIKIDGTIAFVNREIISSGAVGANRPASTSAAATP